MNKRSIMLLFFACGGISQNTLFAMEQGKCIASTSISTPYCEVAVTLSGNDPVASHYYQLYQLQNNAFKTFLRQGKIPDAHFENFVTDLFRDVEKAKKKLATSSELENREDRQQLSEALNNLLAAIKEARKS